MPEKEKEKLAKKGTYWLTFYRRHKDTKEIGACLENCVIRKLTSISSLDLHKIHGKSPWKNAENLNFYKIRKNGFSIYTKNRIGSEIAIC